METRWIGCAPGNFTKGRPRGLRPEAIVIHIIVGSLGSADGHFNNPASKVSAHYAVGKSGEIHQYVDEHDTAYHAGVVVRPTWALLKPRVNPNFYTIGVEHEGLPSDEWPAAQFGASAQLVSEIAQRWNIPVDCEHIIAHREIRATKTCPGGWLKIKDYVSRIPDAEVRPVQYARSVRVVAHVRLRLGVPSTSAPVTRVLPSGALVTVVGFTDTGERVHGNSCWYCDCDGNYFWAGATDMPVPQGSRAAVA